MRGLGRIFRLAVRFSWASKAKFFLLALLVAVGMTVFLVVTELSRVSTEGLEDAIEEDAGATGTYNISLYSDFGLGPEELARQIAEAAAPLSVRPPVLIEAFPPIKPECPPFENLGIQFLLILWDGAGLPVDVPFGRDLPFETQLCFDGQVIPYDAIYLPTRAEQNQWGLGVAIDPTYRDLAALSTTDRVAYSALIVTGRQVNMMAEVVESLESHFRKAALRYGVESATTFQSRLDGGSNIRTASEGVSIVYGIIRWGVLILGGLGLLVAEMIVVRNRTWFFGLARAVGARGRHIAALIILDVLLVLLTGALLAVALTAAAQPTADAFAWDAFQINVRLLHPSAIPQLLLGTLLVLVLASVYPALAATRQDPLDVLEPKTA